MNGTGTASDISGNYKAIILVLIFTLSYRLSRPEKFPGCTYAFAQRQQSEPGYFALHNINMCIEIYRLFAIT